MTTFEPLTRRPLVGRLTLDTSLLRDSSDIKLLEAVPCADGLTRCIIAGSSSCASAKLPASNISVLLCKYDAVSHRQSQSAHEQQRSYFRHCGT